MVRITRRAALFFGALLRPLAAHAAEAPPPLSPAQIALFETPHLASIVAPLELDYEFRREEEGRLPVVDRISMDIRRVGNDGRHDVFPNFLTGERHIDYPPALGFRGNPLLIFALDRDTRELSAATGGSPSWFRGRFRAALLDRAMFRRSRVDAAGQPTPVEATVIEVTPFENEGRARRFQTLRYTFTLSELVPGSIVEIRSTVSAGSDGPAVTESVAFAGARPQ